MTSSCASNLQHVELHVRPSPSYSTSLAALYIMLRCFTIQSLTVSRPSNPGLGLVPNHRGHGACYCFPPLVRLGSNLIMDCVDPCGYSPTLCRIAPSVSTQEAPEKCNSGTVRLPLAQSRVLPHISARTSVQTRPRPVTDPPRDVRPLATATNLLQGNFPVPLSSVCRRHVPQRWPSKR